MDHIKKHSSLLALLLVAVLYLVSLHYYSCWETRIINGGDTWGYYLYLPALFIHHDLAKPAQSIRVKNSYQNDGASKKDSVPKQDSVLNVIELSEVENGNYVNKYTIGLSILYSPFFFSAHLLAKVLGFPQDGYSAIYIYMIFLSSVVFVFAGLWYLRKLLLRYFPDSTTAIVIIIVSVATNLYYFSVFNSAMAHAYLFALYCFLIYNTDQWYKNEKAINAILAGLFAGLITLIRPSELICILIHLFWGITSFSDVRERIDLYIARWRAVMMAAVIFFLCGTPQFFYWKLLTGGFLFYSYGEEGFDFSDPHILSGMFSFNNGWLAYTPIMFLALIGILFLNKQKKFLLPVVTFLPIHIYITYSWWCWNYINGFGSRPMVEAYPLLCFPLSIVVDYIVKNRYLRGIFVTLLLIFCTLNLFQTWQHSEGVLWTENANWAYYKRVFGKTELNYLDLVAYDSGEIQPNSNAISLIDTLHTNYFEDSSSSQYTPKHVYQGAYSYALDRKTAYSPTYKKMISKMDLKGGDWIHVSVQCMRLHDSLDIYGMSKLVAEFGPSGKWRGVGLENKPGNHSNSIWGGKPKVWGEVFFWVQVPNDFNENTYFQCFVWNASGPVIYIDTLQVELWRSNSDNGSLSSL